MIYEKLKGRKIKIKYAVKNQEIYISNNFSPKKLEVHE